MRIRDDTIDHSLTLGSGATADQIAAQIWGPYRFSPRIDRASDDGRSVGPFSLSVGDDRPFQIEFTTVPPWSGASGPDWWRRTYTDAASSIRLLLVCETDRYRWDIPLDVDVPHGLQIY